MIFQIFSSIAMLGIFKNLTSFHEIESEVFVEEAQLEESPEEVLSEWGREVQRDLLRVLLVERVLRQENRWGQLKIFTYVLENAHFYSGNHLWLGNASEIWLKIHFREWGPKSEN